MARRIVPRPALKFTEAEMDRLRWCSQALGSTFEEILHDAAMQMCDEVEGVARQARTLRRLEKIRRSLFEEADS